MPPKKINPKTTVEDAMGKPITAGRVRVCIVATYDSGRLMERASMVEQIVEALDAVRNHGTVEAACVEWPPAEPSIEDITHIQ